MVIRTKPNWKTVRILRIHNLRDGVEPPEILAQIWVTEERDGTQHLLSVKKGQEIRILPSSKEPGLVRMAELLEASKRS